MSVTSDWTWREWSFIIAAIIGGGLTGGLSQMIREGSFGGDLVWFANWVFVIYSAIILLVHFVLRKHFVDYKKRHDVIDD